MLVNERFNTTFGVCVYLSTVVLIVSSSFAPWISYRADDSFRLWALSCKEGFNVCGMTLSDVREMIVTAAVLIGFSAIIIAVLDHKSEPLTRKQMRISRIILLLFTIAAGLLAIFAAVIFKDYYHSNIGWGWYAAIIAGALALCATICLLAFPPPALPDYQSDVAVVHTI